MNERIRELAKQCTSWSEGSTWTSREVFDKEKFAELIVRECTNMLPADTIRNEDGVHMFYVIREHFGVPTIGR